MLAARDVTVFSKISSSSDVNLNLVLFQLYLIFLSTQESGNDTRISVSVTVGSCTVLHIKLFCIMQSM